MTLAMRWKGMNISYNTVCIMHAGVIHYKPTRGWMVEILFLLDRPWQPAGSSWVGGDKEKRKKHKQDNIIVDIINTWSIHKVSFNKKPSDEMDGLLIFFHFRMVQVCDKLWWLSSELTVCNGTNWKERGKRKEIQTKLTHGEGERPKETKIRTLLHKNHH